MKATGIVRKVDGLGRLVLPKELRRVNNIKTTDPLEIFVEDDCIILKKYQPACICCNSVDRLTRYNNITLCKECLNKLNEQERKNL